MSAGGNNVRDALKAIKQLLDMFRFERQVYLGVTLVAFFLLMICFGIFVWKGQMEFAIGMCGSGGVIAYTSSRLLVMWNQAFDLIQRCLGVRKPGDA